MPRFEMTVGAWFDTREEAEWAMKECEEAIGKVDGDLYEAEIEEEDE